MPMIDQNGKNKEHSLAKSSYIVGVMTFISRISGFIRDILFANIFGASANTDAFFVAFKIPNFFRRLFAEGAFIQSFIPVLNDYKTNNHNIKDGVQNLITNIYNEKKDKSIDLMNKIIEEETKDNLLKNNGF